MTCSGLAIKYFTLIVIWGLVPAVSLAANVKISIEPVLLYGVKDDKLALPSGRIEDATFLFSYEKPTEHFWKHAACSSKIIFGVIRKNRPQAKRMIKIVKRHFDKKSRLTTDRRFKLTGICRTLVGRDMSYIDITAIKPLIHSS